MHRQLRMIDRSGVLFIFQPPYPPVLRVPPLEFSANEALLDEYTTEFDATPIHSHSSFVIHNSSFDDTLYVYEGDSIIEGSVLPAKPYINTEKPKNAIPSQQIPQSSLDTLLRPQGTPVLPHTKPRQTFQRRPFPLHSPTFKRMVGGGLLAAALIGLLIPTIPKVTFETSYIIQETQRKAVVQEKQAKPLPTSIPLAFDPLIGSDGKAITPINTDFSIIIPKAGINAPVIAGVDALNVKEYSKALAKGVAHAKSSYLPDQDGATYLFSHSTNYQWFVQDLNALFYNVKNLEAGDLIVLLYKGKRYTYKMVNKEIVPPQDTSYLLPVTGKRMLILQTCWPPGTTENRLLLFADLVEEKGNSI